MSLEWRIASRYLRSRRSLKRAVGSRRRHGRGPPQIMPRRNLVSLITIIATAGVMVGVMALVVVMGVMNGLQTELRDRILIASPHLRILTYGEDMRMDGWRDALPVITAHPDVAAAAPFVLSQGLVTAGHDYQEGIVVVGLASDTGSAAVTTFAQHFTRGDLEFHHERDDVIGGVVLGRHIADRLTAFPGDRLTFISSAGTRYNRAVGGFIPRALAFEVSGDFETGMFEYDNNYVVTNLHAAQVFGALDSAVTGIEVRVADPWEARRVGDEIVATLGHPYRFVDWQTQNANLFAALRLEKLAMGLILLLIILVAAFNIVSMLTMVVADKTREIGILRAMGLSSASVRRIFMLQGAIIGLVGTSFGAASGLGVAFIVDSKRLITIPAEVYFIDHLPVSVDPLDFVVVVVAGFMVAMLATIYPSWRAGGLVPVEAIRHE